MANFKFVVSEPESKKSYQFEVDQFKAASVIGKKINDDFDGDFIGLSGYTLKITGGTDKDGFPMHSKKDGPGKGKLLLIGAPCFHPKIKGQRKRKTVRGNTISEDMMQINTKVVKIGGKTLDEITGKIEKKESPAEEKKEAAPVKEESKVEEKKEEPAKKEEAKVEEKAETSDPKEEAKVEEKAETSDPKEEAKVEEKAETSDPKEEAKVEEKAETSDPKEEAKVEEKKEAAPIKEEKPAETPAPKEEVKTEAPAEKKE